MHLHRREDLGRSGGQRPAASRLLLLRGDGLPTGKATPALVATFRAPPASEGAEGDSSSLGRRGFRV